MQYMTLSASKIIVIAMSPLQMFVVACLSSEEGHRTPGPLQGKLILLKHGQWWTDGVEVVVFRGGGRRSSSELAFAVEFQRTKHTIVLRRTSRARLGRRTRSRSTGVSGQLKGICGNTGDDWSLEARPALPCCCSTRFVARLPEEDRKSVV